MSKIPPISNKLIPTVNEAKEIAIKAGYTPPTAPINNVKEFVQKKVPPVVSEEAAEAYKLAHSPIKIEETPEISANVIKAYKASIGK